MISLHSFIGGLGNQCFQAAAIYTLAKRRGVPFSIINANIPSFANGARPNYKYTIFKRFIELSSKNNIQKRTIVMDQWAAPKNSDFPDNIDTELVCMLMRFENFSESIPDIKRLFFEAITDELKTEIEANKLKDIEKYKNRICLTIRRFTEEKRPDWASSLEYYKRAISRIKHIEGDTIILIFGDDKEWLESVLPELNMPEDVPIYWYIGKRDGQTDIIHFYLMFDCNYFILCNSSYHYWPAVLNNNNELVIYDDSIEWQKKNIIPPFSNWIGL